MFALLTRFAPRRVLTYTGCFRRFGILALMTLFSCAPSRAVDLQQPAHIHVLVQDAAGHLLRGAVVTLQIGPWGKQNTVVAHQETAASGGADLESAHPDGLKATTLYWNVSLHVQEAGFAECVESLNLFPQARFEKDITLRPLRANRSGSTLIRVRGPHGEPLPFVQLSLDYVTLDNRSRIGGIFGSPTYADNRGEYHFEHEPLRGAFAVNVGEARRLFKAAREVVIALSKDDLDALPRPRTFRLKLIAPDGAPAAGWFVSAQVLWNGSYSGGYWETDLFDVQDLQTLGADGVIRLPAAGGRLAVFSPEGVPFLFPLIPQSWTGQEKQITLRIPPVRRTQAGRITMDGKPVSDLSIRAGNLQSKSINCQFRFTNGHQNGQGVGMEKPSDPPRFHPITTGPDGTYKLPVYFGSQMSYTAEKDGRYPTTDLLANDEVALHTAPTAAVTNVSNLKDVTLRFVDEQGQLIPEISSAGYNGYAGQTVIVSSSGDGFADTQGVHLFVDPRIDRLEIHTTAKGWKDLVQTIAIPPTGDFAAAVTVRRDTHLYPLTGVVLAPSGKPLSDATIYLHRHMPGGQQGYLGYDTKTDAKGRFAFAAAPDECELDLSRAESPDGRGGLPGWTDTPLATAAVRNLTIHLHRYVSVRILLPAATRRDPMNASLLGADEYHPYTGLDYDFASRSLRSTRTQPGRYTLALYDKKSYYPVLDAPEKIMVDVAAAPETVVDLRNQKVMPGEGQMPRWAPLTVTAQGVPVSGVTVSIYTTPPPKGQPLPSWLPQPGGFYSNAYGPVVKAIADLSDDIGQVWYPAEPGRRYIAVARQPGRLIGWKSFTVTAGQPVTIEMQPAKTLQVSLHELNVPKGADGTYIPVVRIRLDGVSDEEARALLDSLDILAGTRGWNTGSPDGPTTGEMNREKPLVQVAEDLPPGLTYNLQILRRGGFPIERAVHLKADGPVVQEVQLDYPYGDYPG